MGRKKHTAEEIVAKLLRGVETTAPATIGVPATAATPPTDAAPVRKVRVVLGSPYGN